MKRYILLAACLLLVTLAFAQEPAASRPSSWAQPIKLDGVPNLYKVSDNLYRSAQPTARGIRNLKKIGIKTIINLRTFNSDHNGLKNTGLGFEHIPMNAWQPERKDAIRLLQIVTDLKRTPVLVHCLHGADRTGVMCALYRIAVEGWTKEQAILEMTAGGFNFHAAFSNLSKWIQDLDIDAIKKDAGIKARTEQTPISSLLNVPADNQKPITFTYCRMEALNTDSAFRT